MASKLKTVKFSQIRPWFTNNPRHEASDVADATEMKRIYDRPDMRASIVQNGLIEPLGLMIGDPQRFEDDGVTPQSKDFLYVIKGNTRYYNLAAMVKSGVEKVGDDKSILEIPAIVHDPLTDSELKRLTHDHGHRGLNQYQVALALEGRILANPEATEKDIVWAERMLIDAAFTVDTKKATEFDNPEYSTDKQKDLYLAYRKGILQTIKRCATGPRVMRDEHFHGLKTGAKFLKQEDIREMEKIFKDELKADVTGKINRDNPGPLFLARWQKFVDAKAEALKAGDGGKVKSTSMASRETVLTARNTCQSRLMKLTLNSMARENNFDTTDIPTLDSAAVALEAGNVAEATKIIEELVAKKVPASTSDAK